jgi:hypothetical protein
MSCWWAAVNAMLEMTEAWLAASTIACRSPKSNNSHNSDAAATVPLSDSLPERVVPDVESLPLLCWYPATAVTVILGK